MKTLKQYEKADQGIDFLKPMDRIDDQLYFHILCGWVAPNFDDGNCGQNGECSKSVDDTDYYESVANHDGKYYYLGLLPDFNNKVVHY